MLNLPVLRWGQPYTSMDVDQVVHFSTGEPIAKVSRANGGMIQRDMRKAQSARDALRRLSDRRSHRARGEGRRALHRCRVADGRRHADAGRLRARAVGEHRPARAPVPRQHEEEQVRAERDAAHSHVAHARTRSRGALQGATARNAACPISYQAQSPGSRPRAAVELARRPHAVAADHPDADRTGAEAGSAGAVDAVSHGGSVLPGRNSARSHLGLPGRGRRRRRGARQLRPQPHLRRNRDGRSLSRQPARAGTRPRILEDPARRRSWSTTGSSTST